MNLLNQRVKHKVFGIGTIVDQSDSTITVAFASRSCKFQYPGIDAFTKYLQAEDASVQEALIQETEKLKLEQEAARLAAEEAKRKAQEEARAAEAARLKAEMDSKKHSSTSVTKKSAISRTERVAGQPMTFYVFQGDTFDIESRGGFIWAPKHSQSGGKVFHWDNMLLVKKGDIILHGCDARVVAVSTAVSDCYDCDRPKERTFEDSWNNEGRRVDLDYRVFKTSIKTSDFLEEILEYCRVKYSPFDRDGNGNMGYLYELNRELARIFLKTAARWNPYIMDEEYVQKLLAEASE